MKEYICKEDFKEFFYSPESGTEEVIADLMIKYHLDYLHDIDEENIKDFANDLIIGILNVLDIEEIITKVDICREFAKELKQRIPEAVTYNGHPCHLWWEINWLLVEMEQGDVK